MATYFAGTGVDAFTLSPNLPFQDGALINISNDRYIEASALSPANGQPLVGLKSMWTHAFIWSSDSYFAFREWLTLRTSAGVPIIRSVGAGASSFTLEYWTGSAWVVLRTYSSMGLNGVLDIRLDLNGAESRLQFYWNQQLVDAFPALPLAWAADVGRVRLGTTGNNRPNDLVADVILASYNTIGHAVRLRRPIGPGATNEWVGTWADVGEAGLDDTTTLNTIVTGAKATFAATQLPSTSPGNVIKAVVVAARIRNDGGDVPRNAKAIVRVGGVDQIAPNDMPINAGFIGSVTIFDLNPATGLKWASIAEANGEFGLRASV